MKTCFKCEEEKPYTEFYRHSQMADGHLGKCKACTKADVSKNYRANIDYYKQYDSRRAMLPHRVKARAKYQSTEAGKESVKRSKEKWLSKNPIKRGANVMVGNAIRSGRLVKPKNCDGCGKEKKRIHGHHDDYARPLDVRWLCPACHTAWHRENGEAANG